MRAAEFRAITVAIVLFFTLAVSPGAHATIEYQFDTATCTVTASDGGNPVPLPATFSEPITITGVMYIEGPACTQALWDNLPPIGEITEYLSFYESSLTSLDGLEDLRSISALSIRDNTALTDISALRNVSSIAGVAPEIMIENNSVLTSVELNVDLDGVLFWIHNNPVLTEISGMSITEVDTVTIVGNPLLRSLGGLMSEQSRVVHAIELRDNVQLSSCLTSHLETIATNNGNPSINISGNYQETCTWTLTDVGGVCTASQGALGPRTFWIGDMATSDCGGPSSMSGFEEISAVYGNLSIEGTNLADLPFTALELVTGNLQIELNMSLTNLEGMGELRRVEGNLTSMANGLESLSGLGQLYRVGGNLNVQLEDHLYSALSLSGLTSLGGNLTIQGNENLQTISFGLSDYHHSAGDVQLNNNAELTSISGLTVNNAHTVEVIGNPKLRDIGALLNPGATISRTPPYDGHLTIQDNTVLPGCFALAQANGISPVISPATVTTSGNGTGQSTGFELSYAWVSGRCECTVNWTSTHITGDVNLTGCQVIHGLTPPSGSLETTIDGSLIILDTRLTDLSGFGLLRVRDDVIIEMNPFLQNLHGATDGLSLRSAHDVRVNGNWSLTDMSNLFVADLSKVNRVIVGENTSLTQSNALAAVEVACSQYSNTIMRAENHNNPCPAPTPNYSNWFHATPVALDSCAATLMIAGVDLQWEAVDCGNTHSYACREYDQNGDPIGGWSISTHTGPFDEGYIRCHEFGQDYRFDVPSSQADQDALAEAVNAYLDAGNTETPWINLASAEMENGTDWLPVPYVYTNWNASALGDPNLQCATLTEAAGDATWHLGDCTGPYAYACKTHDDLWEISTQTGGHHDGPTICETYGQDPNDPTNTEGHFARPESSTDNTTLHNLVVTHGSPVWIDAMIQGTSEVLSMAPSRRERRRLFNINRYQKIHFSGTLYWDVASGGVPAKPLADTLVKIYATGAPTDVIASGVTDASGYLDIQTAETLPYIDSYEIEVSLKNDWLRFAPKCSDPNVVPTPDDGRLARSMTRTVTVDPLVPQELDWADDITVELGTLNFSDYIPGSSPPATYTSLLVESADGIQPNGIYSAWNTTMGAVNYQAKYMTPGFVEVCIRRDNDKVGSNRAASASFFHARTRSLHLTKDWNSTSTKEAHARHEMGHKVHFDLVGLDQWGRVVGRANRPGAEDANLCRVGHAAGKTVNAACAFIEGFANFFALLVEGGSFNQPHRMFLDYDVEHYDVLQTPSANYWANYTNSAPILSRWERSRAQADEGWTTAYFYDLVDIHDDHGPSGAPGDPNNTSTTWGQGNVASPASAFVDTEDGVMMAGGRIGIAKVIFNTMRALSPRDRESRFPNRVLESVRQLHPFIRCYYSQAAEQARIDDVGYFNYQIKALDPLVSPPPIRGCIW